MDTDITTAAEKRPKGDPSHDLGIPAKLNTIPERSRTVFRTEGEHRRSEATLAL
jgi:hypothetical protein